MRRRLLPIVCPLLLLAAWEAFGQLRGHLGPVLVSLGCEPARVPDFSFLQPVSAVIPRLYELFATGEILPYLWDTTWRAGVAFFAAAIVGVSLGLLLGLRRLAEELLLPTVDALRTIPPVAALPVIILFFGIDDLMKVVFVFMGGVWPVLISTARATKSVDPIYLKVAINSGHSRFCTLRRVVIPAALPGIFTGLKVSLSISIILAVVSEMLVGNTGLGFHLNYSKRNLAFDDMFASIIVIALLGWVANGVLAAADRRLLAWHYRSRDAQMADHHVAGASR